MMAQWTAPFCSSDSRQAGLLYLAAGYRDTTHSRTPDGIRQELCAILIGCVLARTRTALAVPSASIATAQSLVRPQLKNALVCFARDAALLMPTHPGHALVILQELLQAIRQVKYYKPKAPRPPRPRVNQHPANKWQADRQKKLNNAAYVNSIGGEGWLMV